MITIWSWSNIINIHYKYCITFTAAASDAVESYAAPGEEEYEYSEEEYNGNDGDDIAGDASDLAGGYLAPEEDGQLTLKLLFFTIYCFR